MAGIPTSNILQPGQISIAGGATRALISNMQLIKPSIYSEFTEKYGTELFTQWLSMYGGMEIAPNQEFSWFENQGKLMQGITVVSAQTTTNGSTCTLILSPGFYNNSGTQSPLRVKETLRNAATNAEWEILTIPVTTANAFQFTARPKLATTTETVAAGGVFLFGGYVDAGEASTSIDPLAPINVKLTNYCTQIRETWENTDLAGMTPLWYNSGVSSSGMSGGQLANSGYYTYQGLQDTEKRFLNQTDNKLMIGNLVTNTGLASSTSQGTQGFIPKILQDGETIGYTPGTLDIAFMHSVTRIMDVNGCAVQNLWLMDIWQRQNFSDGLFKEFPAGAFSWGTKAASEEAAIAYGVKSLDIDGYRFQVKKRKEFNTEVLTGLTPNIDRFRNFGVICPLSGETADARDASKKYKNVQIMVQNPPKGGTVGNGIRVWEHGGASINPTNGTMNESVEMIKYTGIRVTAANQFLVVQSA